MDFAKNILSKYGWQDGDGLGKEKQGIKKPIKANLKFDEAGFGATNDFGNNWWERCFNDAAQNVQVQKEQNGKVIVDLKDSELSVEVSTKGYSVKKLRDSGRGVYGNNFLSSDVAASTFAMKKYRVLTDEELFRFCGGRTAHKGARHGLKLSGKLARVQQQEQELLEKMQRSRTGQNEFDTKKCQEYSEANESKFIPENRNKKEKLSKESFKTNLPVEKKNNGIDKSLDACQHENSELEEALNILPKKSKRDKKKEKKVNAIEQDFEEIVDTISDESTETKVRKEKKRTKLSDEKPNNAVTEENQSHKRKRKSVGI